MKTYRFDPDLVAADLPAIQEWCRTHDLVPEHIPCDAKVTVNGELVTVEHYVRNERGGIVIDRDRDVAMRTTRTVRLMVKPELASLKPVDEQGE